MLFRSIRIDRIKGRSDDMFIIKGVNIFPMQVEKILVQFPELGSNYLITLETVNNQDEMIVEVELSDLSTNNYIELEKIRKDIEKTREKIAEQQKRLRALEAQLTEEENLEIVRMVKAVRMDNRELTAFLRAYASGMISLPDGLMETEESEGAEDEA